MTPVEKNYIQSIPAEYSDVDLSGWYAQVNGPVTCFNDYPNGDININMLRAVFEGIVFEHRRRMEKLDNLDLLTSDKPIVLSGGASKSDVFAQMFADVCNRQVLVPAQSQAGAMGGVILAAVANKRFERVEPTVFSLVSYKSSFYPNEENHLCYTQKYKRFVDIFLPGKPYNIFL